MGKNLERAYSDLLIDPTRLVYLATDEYHHSDILRLRVGTDLTRAVEELIASRRYGYRTESDFYRDSGHFRLAFWSVNGYPKAAETCEAMERMHLINALSESRRQFSKWLDDLAKNMNDPATTERQKSEIIFNMYCVIMRISSEREEKELWLKALQERYPKYCPTGFDFSRLAD